MKRQRTRAGLTAALSLGMVLTAQSVGQASTDTTEATEDTAATTERTAATTEGTAAAGGDEVVMAPEVECPAEEPGLSDTAVDLGGTYPLSGPVAAYASIPRASTPTSSTSTSRTVA